MTSCSVAFLQVRSLRHRHHHLRSGLTAAHLGVLNITYGFAHACDELHKHPFSLTYAQVCISKLDDLSAAHSHPQALQDDSYRGQNVILLLRDPRYVDLLSHVQPSSPSAPRSSNSTHRDVTVSAWYEARFRYHPQLHAPRDLSFEDFACVIG